FDGTGQMTAPATGLPIGGTDRSLELWVRIDAQNAMDGIVAGWGTAGVANAMYWLCTLGAGNGLLPCFSQWGRNINGGALKLGEWAHMAVATLNGTSYLYVNGQQVASGALAINVPQGSSFRIGRADNQAYFMRGAVDEVTVYNRAL